MRSRTVRDDLRAAIVPGEERTPAPKSLTRAEKRYWVEHMESLPPGWFGRETLPYLRTLCRFQVLCDSALEKLTDPDLGSVEFERRQRAANLALLAVLRISTHLRMTPKSRLEFSRKKDETGSRTRPIRPWEIAVGNGGPAAAERR
jgi:hypothetical protein